MCTCVDTPVQECQLPYLLQPASPWPTLEGTGLGPMGSPVSGVWPKGQGLGAERAPHSSSCVEKHRKVQNRGIQGREPLIQV